MPRLSLFTDIEWVKVKCKNVCWKCLPYLSPFFRYSNSNYAWPWPLPLEWVKLKPKYTNWNLICGFIFDFNSFWRNCHRLRDVYTRNVLDLDLYNGPRSNVNMPIERAHATCYVPPIEMFALSVTVYVIFTHDRPNVLDSYLWPWTRKSRT